MRDFGASGMVVGLVDPASLNGDQVLTHAVARQSRQRRVVVDEQPPQIAVAVARVGVREVEDEVRGTELCSLLQLGLEVELSCRIAAHYRHTNAEYRHDRRQPNCRRRHLAVISMLTAFTSDIDSHPTATHSDTISNALALRSRNFRSQSRP
jgi:hypothetical protein